jgi:tetratricopeptide (TPR) repeat protein
VDTGKSAFLEVGVQRQDCTGPVRLEVEGLPEGVRAVPATLSANQDNARVELRAADDIAAGSKTVRVRAELGNLHVEQQALVTVRVAPGVTLSMLDSVSLQRRLHRTLSVRLKRRNYTGAVDLRFEGLPDGVKSHPATIPAGADFGRLEITAQQRAGLQSSEVRVVAVAPGIRAENPLRLTVVATRPQSEWLADYDEAVRQHPDDAGNYCDRGRLYFERKENAKALADFEKALQLDPGYSAAYYNRASVYVRSKEFDKAMDDCDRAVELDPHSSSAFNCRGVCWAEKGELARALDDYTKAIQLEPRYAIAFSNRGNVYSRQHLWDKALTEYDEAIRLDPSYVLAYIGRGTVYRTQKHFDKALADCNAIVRLDPQSVVGFNNRGNIYLDKGDYDKAITDYTDALRLDPTYVLAYQNRARAYEKKGDTEKAKADRAKAKDLSPPAPPAAPKAKTA